MEDTLRVNETIIKISAFHSLNPCFNGRYSQRIWDSWDGHLNIVLILVLMEDTLRGSHRSLRYHYQVLILVLMEDTLRVL